jgi:hypothetical protein
VWVLVVGQASTISDALEVCTLRLALDSY